MAKPTRSLVKKGARVDSGVATSAIKNLDAKIIGNTAKRKVGGL